MEYTKTSLLQSQPIVKRQRQDKVNLARSRGEYVTKASRNVALNMAQQAPHPRERADEMLWA